MIWGSRVLYLDGEPRRFLGTGLGRGSVCDVTTEIKTEWRGEPLSTLSAQYNKRDDTEDSNEIISELLKPFCIHNTSFMLLSLTSLYTVANQ